MPKAVKRVLFYSGIIAVWYLISLMGIWPSYMLPSPLKVTNSLIDGIRDRTFIIGALVSIKRIFIGYGLSVVFGTMLGLAIGRIKSLDETMGSLVVALQTLPSICWLPLAILWFGLSEKAITFVVIMGALLSITISTDCGVKNINPIYLKAGRNMGARGVSLLTTVLFPAALPTIISGLKQGWSFAWRSLMAGELLYVSLGLGQLLMMGRELNDMSRVLAVMLVLVLIGMFFDQLIFAKLEKAVRVRWGLNGSS